MLAKRKREASLSTGRSRRERVRGFLLGMVANGLRASRTFSSGRPRSSIRRVLLIRPDHLGDFLFATPALELWRQQTVPFVETTLSIGPWCAELARHGPKAGAIETFDYPGFARQPKTGLWAPYRALLRHARAIRRTGYEAGVVMRFDHWWGGLLLGLAGIPTRIGYATDPLCQFLTDALPYHGAVHEVSRNLDLVRHALASIGAESELCSDEIPSLTYRVDPEERETVDRLLLEIGIGESDPFVVIHPSAGATVKEWPARRFAAVADGLIRQQGVRVLLTGARSDMGTAWKVAAYMQEEVHVLAGKTSLSELAALLERSTLVIGADSGPLHLAVAVGAPTIHLYGPVDPALFGPWSWRSDRHRVLMTDCPCAPCNRLDFEPAELSAHRCMETIRVDDVLETAMMLLKPTASPA